MKNSIIIQKIMATVVILLMLGFGIVTIVCLIRLQENYMTIHSLQGQVRTLEAQFQGGTSNMANNNVLLKKMGITLVSPKLNSEVTNPILVQGYANVFEGNVQMRIKDASDNILGHDFATACMGDWPCYFEKEISFTQLVAGDIKLDVYTLSPKDGAEANLVSVSLKVK